MNAVVDASVAVKWLLPDSEDEPHLDRALALLQEIKSGRVTPLQPPHWLAEVAAVITRLRPEIAKESVQVLHAMELPVFEEVEVFTRAVAIAEDLDHHVFDTLYHAVALEHGATLITADEHYYRKARHLGSLIRLQNYGKTPVDRPSGGADGPTPPAPAGEPE